MRLLLKILFIVPFLFSSCSQSIEEIEKLPEAERGKALYDAKCASCHGEAGKEKAHRQRSPFQYFQL